MNNKISIIIPAYNTEAYLAATLDSVLAQTHQNIEVIIVNDGSTDGTAAIIDDYARRDSRITAIHKENGGVTSARLRGIEESTGEYIGFVDSDDIIEPQMYADLLHNAITYDADISHCGYQLHLPNQAPRMFYGTGKLEVMDHLTGLREIIVCTQIEPGLWNKLYRRQVVLAALQDNPIPPTIRNNEDLLMNFRLFSHAEQTVFHDVCPYHYIARSNSASRSLLSSHHILDPLIVSQLIRDNAPDELHDIARQRCLYAGMDYYNLILYHGGNNYTAEKKQIRSFLRENQKDFHLLTTGNRLKFVAILYFPWLYDRVYQFTRRFRKPSAYL